MMTPNPKRDSLGDFLGFVSDILPHSYAQRFQDLWFLWETGFRRTGYFVEFGALNGRDFSNTYTLEKSGWNGIVAEPHPDCEASIRAHRTCNISTKCVYSRSGETVTFNIVKGRPALSSVGHLTVQDDKQALRSNFRAIEVPTISLNDLLSGFKAPSVVDCLSIDTEGSEPEILEAYDFQKRPINCICVEHNGVSRDRLFDLLTRNGYRRKFEDVSGHDDWYVLEGAYPDWQASGAEAIKAEMRKLPRFETVLTEREKVLAGVIAAHG